MSNTRYLIPAWARPEYRCDCWDRNIREQCKSNGLCNGWIGAEGASRNVLPGRRTKDKKYEARSNIDCAYCCEANCPTGNGEAGVSKSGVRDQPTPNLKYCPCFLEDGRPKRGCRAKGEGGQEYCKIFYITNQIGCAECRIKRCRGVDWTFSQGMRLCQCRVENGLYPEDPESRCNTYKKDDAGLEVKPCTEVTISRSGTCLWCQKAKCPIRSESTSALRSQPQEPSGVISKAPNLATSLLQYGHVYSTIQAAPNPMAPMGTFTNNINNYTGPNYFLGSQQSLVHQGLQSMENPSAAPSPGSQTQASPAGRTQPQKQQAQSQAQMATNEQTQQYYQPQQPPQYSSQVPVYRQHPLITQNAPPEFFFDTSDSEQTNPVQESMMYQPVMYRQQQQQSQPESGTISQSSLNNPQQILPSGSLQQFMLPQQNAAHGYQYPSQHPRPQHMQPQPNSGTLPQTNLNNPQQQLLSGSQQPSTSLSQPMYNQYQQQPTAFYQPQPTAFHQQQPISYQPQKQQQQQPISYQQQQHISFQPQQEPPPVRSPQRAPPDPPDLPKTINPQDLIKNHEVEVQLQYAYQRPMTRSQVAATAAEPSSTHTCPTLVSDPCGSQKQKRAAPSSSSSSSAGSARGDNEEGRRGGNKKKDKHRGKKSKS